MENELIRDSNSSDCNCEAGGSQQTNKRKSEKIINLLFYFSIMLFFIGFNFADYSPFGWYQQFLPNLNGASITDITFTDSLNGYAVTNIGNTNSYILKTTNGGDNWTIKLSYNQMFSRVEFINSNVGYTTAFLKLFKTTNAGENWNTIDLPDIVGEDMFVLNEDTIWLVMRESLTGGVFLTINGGLNWTRQFSGGTENPNKVYFYNSRIGFITNNTGGLKNIRKTSNGGLNWFIIDSAESFRDIYFVDSLTGWRAWSVDSIKKTTNGGTSWFKQLLPPSLQIGESGIFKFSFLNKDTIWAVGAIKYYVPTPTEVRGLIYISTNGGESWGYQLPNPNQINVNRYYFVNFVNKLDGWAYTINKGVHTVTGGDTTIYTGIRNINIEISKDYKLYQNYPNPFNAISKIKYKISKSSNIKIKIYDISGKELNTLIDKQQNQGEYEITFDGGNLSSGIYYYMLFADGQAIDSKKAILVK